MLLTTSLWLLVLASTASGGARHVGLLLVWIVRAVEEFGVVEDGRVVTRRVPCEYLVWGCKMVLMVRCALLCEYPSSPLSSHTTKVAICDKCGLRWQPRWMHRHMTLDATYDAALQSHLGNTFACYHSIRYCSECYPKSRMSYQVASKPMTPNIVMQAKLGDCGVQIELSVYGLSEDMPRSAECVSHHTAH